MRGSQRSRPPSRRRSDGSQARSHSPCARARALVFRPVDPRYAGRVAGSRGRTRTYGVSGSTVSKVSKVQPEEVSPVTMRLSASGLWVSSVLGSKSSSPDDA